jgi:serine/threonine-protein kinase
MHQQGKFKDAAPIMDEWTRIVSAQPPETTAVRAQQLKYRGTILQYGGHLDQAGIMFVEALAINRALYGDRHRQVAESIEDVAGVLDDLHRSTEAEAMMREAVGTLRYLFPTGHTSLVQGLRLHGIVLEHMNRFEDAKAPLREALPMAIRYQGQHGQSVVQTKLDLAFALIMTNGPDEAAGLCRDAIADLRAKYGENSPLTQSGNLCLGDALRAQQRYAEAESLLLGVRNAFAAGRPSAVSQAHLNAALVRLYESEGREAEAAKYRPSKTP